MKTVSACFLVFYVSGTVSCIEAAEARQFFPTNVTPDVVVDMSSATRRQLLANYLEHTNRWATADLLPIAIAFAMEGHRTLSENVYTNYLNIRPNDPRANRGLGGVYLMEKRYSEAFDFLGRAWRLGDEDSLPPLAGAYLATGQRDRVRDLVPDMLRLKDKAKTALRNNLIDALLGYALTGDPFNKKVFDQTIDGLSDNEILANSGAPELVIKGLKLSGDMKRAATLERRLERQKQPKTKDKVL